MACYQILRSHSWEWLFFILSSELCKELFHHHHLLSSSSSRFPWAILGLPAKYFAILQVFFFCICSAGLHSRRLGPPWAIPTGRQQAQCLWEGCLCVWTCRHCPHQSNLSEAWKSLKVGPAPIGFQRSTAGSESHRSLTVVQDWGKNSPPDKRIKPLSSQMGKSISNVWAKINQEIAICAH